MVNTFYVFGAWMMSHALTKGVGCTHISREASHNFSLAQTANKALMIGWRGWWTIGLVSMGVAYLERNKTRFGIGSADPFFGRDRRLVWQRVGVEILLEQLGLPWHRHCDHLTESAVVESVETRDFAGADVTATLWHKANSSLGIGCLEGVDVVNERRLGRDLEVANHGVAFAAQKHHVGVGIVKREHDAVGRVQVDHDDGFGEGVGCAKTVLPFRRSIEPKTRLRKVSWLLAWKENFNSPCCENEPVTQEDRACRFRAFMTKRFGFNFAGAWVDDANLLVLAGRHEFRAVPVEACTEDDVGMAVHVKQHFAGADIPDDDLIVRSGCQQHVQSRRMP